MDDQSFDQGREATAVQDSSTTFDGAESLLNELSGVFDEFGPPSPPTSLADTPEPLGEPAEAVTSEEIPVTSPPRVEPPAAIIWKPSRRARFRFRR